MDGVLDRAALAAIVFADDAARQRLEDIVHDLRGIPTAIRGPADLVYDVH